MSVSWNYYDKFESLINLYMLPRGEGDTMATQAVTAVNKLVYKWYNDGDVYDNTFQLKGWCNDLTSFANWLYQNLSDNISGILESIEDCESNDDYEELLQELADAVLDEEYLRELNKHPKEGSIYNCVGPFEFVEYDDEEDY